MELNSITAGSVSFRAMGCGGNAKLDTSANFKVRRSGLEDVTSEDNLPFVHE